MAINYDTHNNVSVVMPKELHEGIKELAKRNMRSVSAEICILVKKALEENNIQEKGQ